MLVVLVILGLAGAIVLPMLGSTGDLETTAAARKLTSDLQYAQDFARTRQTNVRVTFDGNTNTYTLLEVPSVGEPTVLTHPVTKKPFVVSFASTEGMKKVDIGDIDFLGNTLVTYDSYGAPDQGGSVTLISGEQSKIVSIAPVTGRVSVQ